MRFPTIKALIILLLASQPDFAQQRTVSIRSVDFANFTYPMAADLINPAKPKRLFALRSGKFPGDCDYSSFIETVGATLEDVSYGDVTNDGVEDAIVTMSVQTCGSAILGLVYIYSLRGGRPRLLWYFRTGDRADGGLHEVYAENGGLVVELNGPKRRIEGDCCPMRFTRRHYVWRGGRFHQKGRMEIIPIPVAQ